MCTVKIFRSVDLKRVDQIEIVYLYHSHFLIPFFSFSLILVTIEFNKLIILVFLSSFVLTENHWGTIRILASN